MSITVRSRIRYACVGCAIVGVISCSDKPRDPLGPGTGTLSERVAKIHTSEYLTQCDYKKADIQKTIAQELDRRSSEIEDYAKTHSVNTQITRSQFGPLMIRDIRTRPAIRPGWTRNYSSWDLIEKAYQAIQGKPVDQNWIDLVIDVRSILVDDELRLVEDMNYEINHTSAPVVVQLADLFSTCSKTNSCASVALTENQKTVIFRNMIFRYFWNRMEETTTVDARNARFLKFANRLEFDARQLRFQYQPAYKRTSQSELIVPVDPGVFASVTEPMRELMESMWSSPTLKVKIQWTSSQSIQLPIFSFVLGQGWGGRPWTSFTNHQVTFYNDIRKTSFAHEFGHVLGFRDHYYTIFDQDVCEYYEETSDEDVMSNSLTGSVTAEEWKTLDEMYPVK